MGMQSIVTGSTMDFLNSSFGEGGTVFDGSFSAQNHISSERASTLDYRLSYYLCTQHDGKRYDFDGRMLAGWNNPRTPSQPLITGERVAWYVPLRERRPSAPYRLAKMIVSAFTRLTFGEYRFPQLQVHGDEDAQDFVNAIVKYADLPTCMIRARNLGGAAGAVGLSWCFYEGRPSVTVHNPKDICIHDWENRNRCIPKHVSEITMVPKEEYDQKKKQYVRNWYWFRRDWMPNADLVFKECLYEKGKEPNWEPDYEKSVVHKDGVCHFVWIQNCPDDDIDGIPDYEGLFEQLDEIDVVFSTISRSTKLNLDPTLVLRMDYDLVQRMGVRKGSDNALTVGPNGDAKYMEMSGSGISAALTVFKELRSTALEVANCIIVDPNVIAAQGVSAVALKAIYAPMLGECDIRRTQYGSGLNRLLTDMLRVAQRMFSTGGVALTVDAEGNTQEQEVDFEIKFPPRVKTVPVTDAITGDVVGEKQVLVPHHPGQSYEIDLIWGGYFNPTPDDQAKTVQTMSIATGGATSLSQESAVQFVASSLGLVGADEWKKVQAATEKKRQEQSQMFGDPGSVGGAVEGDELPMGALPRRPREDTPQEDMGPTIDDVSDDSNG